MIKEQLLKFYNWQPLEFTDKKEPKLDLKAIELMSENLEKYPFAKYLEKYFIVDKLLGQLARGEKSWLNMLKDNILYGKIHTQGAVTSRCTHSDPNLAQIPAVDKPFGAECRDLFEARENFKLVGVDAKGLELRCLAHYMNDSQYTDLILNGDIHSFNQNILKEVAPLITRNIAKTWIYAFLYGGQNKLLGQKVGGTTQTGKKMREKFLEKLPKLNELVKQVNEMAKQGYLLTIDGRYIPLTSKHASLNYLLQSTGAVVMKKALCFLYQDLCALGWCFGREYAFILNVHDEIQAEVKPEYVEKYKKLAVKSIQKAGEYYNFNCKLDGEAKVGKTWKDTH